MLNYLLYHIISISFSFQKAILPVAVFSAIGLGAFAYVDLLNRSNMLANRAEALEDRDVELQANREGHT